VRLSPQVRRAIVLGLAVTAPAQATTTPGDVVRFSFDGTRPLTDVSGHGHHLVPVSRHGGALTVVPHSAGTALDFPPPCRREPCPRIALRARTTDDLNPGTKTIRYGASVRLSAAETGKGENIVQKGFSTRGSQYKLQIDGVPGRPSCVLVDDRRPRIYAVVSTVGVADGRWHTLECRRAGGRLTVLVDGSARGAGAVPADLSVRNRIPLSIGGKGSFTDNDQFQGMLDEVWVQIG
jgi:concanavalin A-like lectin/glucanase superfamily protein